MTAKSLTVTQLGSSYSTMSGYRTAGTDYVLVGVERSTANDVVRQAVPELGSGDRQG